MTHAPAIQPHQIPGMIEPAEQQMLFSLARELEFQPGDSIVEFGTFFGRSTACLVNGVAARKPGDAAVPLVAYDSFCCPAEGDFSKYVKIFAAQGGGEHLLTTQDGVVNFRAVFDKYLGPAQSEGRLNVFACELDAAQWHGGPIGLMHLDAPKSYIDLKPLMERFFTHLHVASVVIFQDYFFRWSGSVIAAAQFMIEAGFLRPVTNVASSLITEVTKPFDATAVNSIDAQVRGCFCPDVIDRAIGMFQNRVNDPARVLYPQLALSKIPFFWEKGRYEDAARCWDMALALSGRKPPYDPMTDNLLDMLTLGMGASFGDQIGGEK